MPFIVINEFRDKEDNNTIYQVGEEYPKGDYKPSKNRIKELSKDHPKYNKSFIKEITDENSQEPLQNNDGKENNSQETNDNKE